MKALILAAMMVAPPSYAYQEYSPVGQEDDLRMSMGMGVANLEQGSQTSLFGEFDYYLHNVVSLYGDSQIPLQPVEKLKPYFMGMGFHFHLFNLSSLDFFTGFGGGLTLYTHPELPTKAFTTMDVSAGMVLFGSVFHVFGKVAYRRSEYFGGGVFIDHNHLFYVAGMGFQF